MTDILRYHWVYLLVVAPFVGSFLGVVAQRLPVGRSIARPRSSCPACGHRLAARDLVPILSWVVNRAACRFCGAPVSWFYPAIELAALGIAVWSLAVVPGWLAWATSALGWALLTLAAIDARHLILPDEITLPLAPAGLAVAWAVDPARLGDHAIGTLAGFAFVALVRWAYGRLRGREGIGLGDAKLFAAAGAWVGWQGLPSVLLLAAGAALATHLVAAALTRRSLRGRELSFGPFIAAGLWLVWLYGSITI
ncbi:MAG: prepilin peptidase [Kiloniellaceae bacterium]